MQTSETVWDARTQQYLVRRGNRWVVYDRAGQSAQARAPSSRAADLSAALAHLHITGDPRAPAYGASIVAPTSSQIDDARSPRYRPIHRASDAQEHVHSQIAYRSSNDQEHVGSVPAYQNRGRGDLSNTGRIYTPVASDALQERHTVDDSRDHEAIAQYQNGTIAAH